MFKHWMEIVHNHGNDYRDSKDSQLRDYLEVYSLSSGQVFLRVQLKTFSKFSGWTFNIFFCF